MDEHHPGGWGRTRVRAGLVFLAVAVRVLYWLSTLHYRPISDAASYRDIASYLAAGKGFSERYPQVALHPTAFRPPGYPVLLSAVYRVMGPSVAAGRVLNLVIGVGVVVGVEILVSRMGGRRAGLVAAFLVAIYPPLVVNDVMVLADSLSLLLLVLALLALQSGRVVTAGLLLGGVVVSRDSAQLLPVVLAVVVISWFGLRRAALVAGLAYLVVVPWVVRNDIQLGAPVLNTSNGFNLAAVYSPQALAAGRYTDPYYSPLFASYRQTQQDEVEWDSQLRDLGLAGLRQHPLSPLRVAGPNILAYFEIQPHRNLPAEILDGRNLTVRRWSLPLFYFVTIIGVAGLALYRRNPTARLIAVCAIYFTVLSLLSVAPPRLRAPFDLACCIGVGLATTKLSDRIHRWNRRPSRDQDFKHGVQRPQPRAATQLPLHHPIMHRQALTRRNVARGERPDEVGTVSESPSWPPG